MSEAVRKAAEWWSDPGSEAPGTQWVQVPGVKESINRRATGDPAIDWVGHSASLLASFTKPINVLSIGCGFGAIERLLRRRDYCHNVHGVDIVGRQLKRRPKQPKQNAWKVRRTRSLI